MQEWPAWWRRGRWRGGRHCSGWWRESQSSGGPTGKTQVAKARFPIRSHRLDSTWRPAGSVAEAAWVSALGSGGGVVFLVVGQANPARELLPFFVGSFLADWRRWSVNKENSDCRGNVVPCAGSHRSDSTGKPAGGVVKVAWVSALAKDWKPASGGASVGCGGGHSINKLWLGHITIYTMTKTSA
uniref:Uncharacterized protein n=1 Tax=Oryza glumipatula TaxID=40148 RepID=A0A0D9ZYJ7_9ORYZ